MGKWDPVAGGPTDFVDGTTTVSANFLNAQAIVFGDLTDLADELDPGDVGVVDEYDAALFLGQNIGTLAPGAGTFRWAYDGRYVYRVDATNVTLYDRAGVFLAAGPHGIAMGTIRDAESDGEKLCVAHGNLVQQIALSNINTGTGTLTAVSEWVYDHGASVWSLAMDGARTYASCSANGSSHTLVAIVRGGAGAVAALWTINGTSTQSRALKVRNRLAYMDSATLHFVTADDGLNDKTLAVGIQPISTAQRRMLATDGNTVFVMGENTGTPNQLDVKRVNPFGQVVALLGTTFSIAAGFGTLPNIAADGENIALFYQAAAVDHLQIWPMPSIRDGLGDLGTPRIDETGQAYEGELWLDGFRYFATRLSSPMVMDIKTLDAGPRHVRRYASTDEYRKGPARIASIL